MAKPKPKTGPDEPVAATPQVVSQISQSLGEDFTDEQVNMVLAAWNAARAGDPVGTVKRDPGTGAVAHRVDADGVHMWKVTAPDGTQYNDMQPTLPWESIIEVEGR